jgi:hypothetical protein
MPGARFVFVSGEEYARGERFPPHAEVRTEEGVFHARVDGDDTSGWEPVLTRGARADAVEAARKVGEVLSADGWLAALTPAAPRP